MTRLIDYLRDGIPNTLAKGTVGTGSGIIAATVAAAHDPMVQGMGYFLAIVVSFLTAVSVSLDIARKVRDWNVRRKSK